jgi:acid phosphatase (class A)
LINRRHVVSFILTFALYVATPACAQQASFLKPGDAPLVALIAPPPPNDSETTKNEIAAYHTMEAKRTDEEAKFAVADDDASVFRFLQGMGIETDPEKLPLTLVFFKRVGATQVQFINPSKQIWFRTRMSAVDTTINPLIEVPRSTAYPSGHATTATLFAIALSQMFPEKRDAFFARADQFGRSRFVVGVHYPSDNEAAKIAGAVIGNALLHNEEFTKELALVKAELSPILEPKP